MVDKTLLMARGGVLSVTRKLADGKEHAIYYQARMPSEVAGIRRAIVAFSVDEAGGIALDAYLGKFLASALCNEDGSTLMSVDEAARIPDTLKIEIALQIVNGSSEIGEAGKG